MSRPAPDPGSITGSITGTITGVVGGSGSIEVVYGEVGNALPWTTGIAGRTRGTAAIRLATGA